MAQNTNVGDRQVAVSLVVDHKQAFSVKFERFPRRRCNVRSVGIASITND
jgi:hypothetical protein